VEPIFLEFLASTCYNDVMSKEMAIILLGLTVLIVPISGFPESWRATFLFLAGVGIFGIGCMMRVREISKRTKNNSFTESRGDVNSSEQAHCDDKKDVKHDDLDNVAHHE